jgi:hypothetical protein
MHRFRKALGRFAADTGGQLSIEAALMVPMIVWIYVSTFTYFETFRADSANVKAAYAIGDMLSRETAEVNQSYIDGLNGIFSYMTVARQETWLRVSSVAWDDAGQKFVLRWSAASAGHAPLDTVDPIAASIPAMSPGDTVVVVETYMPYTPEFNIGLDPFTYRNVVVTRPRFASYLRWAS